MKLMPVHDEDMREYLIRIDVHEDILLGQWETNWMENSVYKFKGLWSVEQRATAYRIVRKYLQQL